MGGECFKIDIIVTKKQIKKIVKDNAIVRKNGKFKEFVFKKIDIELPAQELDHKINVLKMSV